MMKDFETAFDLLDFNFSNKEEIRDRRVVWKNICKKSGFNLIESTLCLKECSNIGASMVAR